MPQPDRTKEYTAQRPSSNNTTEKEEKKRIYTKSVWSNHFHGFTTSSLPINEQWNVRIGAQFILLCFWGATVNKALSSQLNKPVHV